MITSTIQAGVRCTYMYQRCTRCLCAFRDSEGQLKFVKRSAQKCSQVDPDLLSHKTATQFHKVAAASSLSQSLVYISRLGKSGTLVEDVMDSLFCDATWPVSIKAQIPEVHMLALDHPAPVRSQFSVAYSLRGLFWSMPDGKLVFGMIKSLVGREVCCQFVLHVWGRKI